jgi:hypothetical protein
VLLLLPRIPGPAQAQSIQPAGQTRIAYVSAAHAYLPAGAEDGVAVGQILEVTRGETVIGRIRVVSCASHRAACEVVPPAFAPQVGDVVRFAPAVTAKESAAPPGETTEGKQARRPSPERHVRGRIGLRTMAMRVRGDQKSDFFRPGIDVRLEATGSKAAPWGFSIDARSRRSYRWVQGSERDLNEQTRVNRLVGTYGSAGAQVRLSVGRQIDPVLGPLGPIDGIRLEHARHSLQLGLLAATVPNPATGDLRTGRSAYGLTAQWSTGTARRRQTSLSAGAAGTYERGGADREFLSLHARFHDTRVSLLASQEIDLLRGDRRRPGGGAVQSTNLTTQGRLRAASWLQLRAGYDNRRGIPTELDPETPEAAFDASTREGLSFGFEVTPRPGWRAAADMRSLSREGEVGNRTTTLTAWRGNWTGWDIDLRARATRFDGDTIEGWLGSVSLGATPRPAFHLEVQAGRRDQDLPGAAEDSPRTVWNSAGLDWSFARRWILMLSVERESRGSVTTDAAFTTLAWRF